MNKHLQDFARKFIIEKLDCLSQEHHRTFRLMYARNGGRRSVNDALAMPLSSVIKEIPENQLSHAMDQVEESVRRLES